MKQPTLDAEKVVDLMISGDMSVDELVRGLRASGGFVAKKIGVAVDIWERMVRDEQCTRFFSFPACIVATGCRGVIRDLVKRKLVDVLITTCGTLDHDIARSWRDYYHGDFSMDDEQLRESGINRLGNVLVPDESYGKILEEKIQPVLEELWKAGKREFSVKELVWEFGRRLGEGSILHWAFKNEIPVYVPGIFDGAFGSQLWLFWQTHRELRIDQFSDEQELADLTFNAEKTGALVVGGGISKHHLLWWNQFRGGLDYAIYITTAVEWDGSLSGARAREAVSWKKIKPAAARVTVEGDATIVLPLMAVALLQRLK
jgi:deoxyhypusine synthase